jgi:hypothetical protein
VATRPEHETRLTIAIGDGVMNLRLRIQVRWLLAILAASATLTGSPALVAALKQWAG